MARLTLLAILLALLSQGCRGEDLIKLQIGTAAAPPAVTGFSVEDLRPDSARKSSIEQAGAKSFVASVFSSDGTAAVKINFGDSDLSVSPIALLVGKLGARSGDKLAGKVLRVREFSFTATRTGKDLLHLDVTISAELGDLHFQGRDFGDVLYQTKGGDDQGKTAQLVDSAMENALYSLHRAELAAEPAHPGDAPAADADENSDSADAEPARVFTPACLARIAARAARATTTDSSSRNTAASKEAPSSGGTEEGAVPDTPPADAAKLIIGGLDALPRPPGFVVEDARPEPMRVSSSTKTYQRSPFAMGFGGPLAIYSLNFGDLDLNVSPPDLLAEALIADKGDTLAGKTLVVDEFSFTGEKRINHPASLVVIPIGAAAIIPALIGTLGGTALFQALQNSKVRLDVKIVATLDGRTIDGKDFGDVVVGDDHGATARIVQGAISAFLYDMDCFDDQPVQHAPASAAAPGTANAPATATVPVTSPALPEDPAAAKPKQPSEAAR